MSSSFIGSNATIGPTLSATTLTDDPRIRAWERGATNASRDALLDSARDKISRLMQLPRGWDGHRATAPEAVAGMVANGILQRLVFDASATPQIAPNGDGAIEIEWLVEGTSVQVQVTREGEVLVLAEDLGGRELLDGAFWYWEPDFLLLDQVRAHLEKMSHHVEVRATAS